MEMNDLNENINDNPPSSAINQSTNNSKDDQEIDRKSLFRSSTGSKHRKIKHHSRISSSSSLHSLVSILKPVNPSHAEQRSVPNVSFGDCYNDINVRVSKNSLIANQSNCSASQFNDGLEMGEGSHRIGSISTQTSTIGFRASFFSVLEKLGVLKSQDLYKSSQNTSEQKFPISEHRTARSSITSLYYRTFYGGKYHSKITCVTQLVVKTHKINHS